MGLNKIKVYLVLASFLFLACSENSVPINDEVTNDNPLVFTDGKTNKSCNIYYHSPKNATSNSPIVFVFHGASRNAKDYRNAIISKANEFNFIAVVPEFSDENFPGGDGYNLGNVFVDGDNPSDNTLNPKDEWAFSLIEPMFNFVKDEFENNIVKYDIIGHSAGAQFAHRLVAFIPDASYNKIVVSAAGWYTVPDSDINFPYGFQQSPLEQLNLQYFFSKNIYIQVGELDNNPNAGGLRRNDIVDAQGINRFQRAYHFYNESKNSALSNNITFNWNIQTNYGLGHDFRAALPIAVDIIFK